MPSRSFPMMSSMTTVKPASKKLAASSDETLQRIGFDVDTPVEALGQEPRNGRLGGTRDARDEEDTRIHIVGFHGKPPFPIIRRPREEARLFHAMKTFVAT